MAKTMTKEYREGVASYNAWKRMNKKFEDQGLYGTDYYVKRVELLEEKEKAAWLLEAKRNEQKELDEFGTRKQR